MAASGDTRVCVQVAENTTEPATIGRELKPLRAIRDAHSKAVMAMRGGYPTEVDSIKILGAADFLLHRRRDCVNGGLITVFTHRRRWRLCHDPRTKRNSAARCGTQKCGSKPHRLIPTLSSSFAVVTFQLGLVWLSICPPCLFRFNVLLFRSSLCARSRTPRRAARQRRESSRPPPPGTYCVPRAPPSLFSR